MMRMATSCLVVVHRLWQALVGLVLVLRACKTLTKQQAWSTIIRTRPCTKSSTCTATVSSAAPLAPHLGICKAQHTACAPVVWAYLRSALKMQASCLKEQT